MSDVKTVLITGASGNLGTKLRNHLQGRYSLRLLDLDPKGDTEIIQADFGQWEERWAETFAGAEVVVHLAANPNPNMSWPEVIGSNIDGLINVFTVAARAGVKRLIYASSNHAMGRYKDILEPQILGMDTPPQPGTFYEINGQARDSLPYGAAKLIGERLGKSYHEIYGMSVIAVRIGWVRHGDNAAAAVNQALATFDIPDEFKTWLRLMWLSDRDFCQLFEACIRADNSVGFTVVNGMSANSGMRWDLDHTRRVVGYAPQDDITRPE